MNRSGVSLDRSEIVMSHPTLRFFSLLLAAPGLAPGAAHLLEMPVKLGYTPERYFAVTSSLYAFFGSAGAPSQRPMERGDRVALAVTSAGLRRAAISLGVRARSRVCPVARRLLLLAVVGRPR
jgi:hypothetical protein